LRDAQRAGLVLVELKRGNELAREALELALNSSSRAVCFILGQPFRDVAMSQREGALDRLGLRGSDVQLAGDRDVQARTAPVEDARELTDPPVGDGKRRPVVADRDDDDGCV